MDAALARLEAGLEACRCAEPDSLAALPDLNGHGLPERQAAIEREIARCEKRLRELFGGDAPDDDED